MMVKNILYISYDGMTDALGQSQVIPYLTQLTPFGYRFTILSCEKPQALAANQLLVEQCLKAFPIEWVRQPYHKSPPMLSGWWDYMALKQAAKKLHRQQHFDGVHARSGLAALVALHLKKKYGLPFLNDVRGFWADERVDGGLWNLRNPIYKIAYHFFKQKENQCLQNANYTICLTEKARAEILSKKTIPIEVIPCCVDMHLFNPQHLDALEREKCKMELGIQASTMVISYLGSLGGWYLTQEMMRFFKLVSDAMPQAKILFITPHPYQRVLAAANAVGLPAHRLMLQHASRAQVPMLLSLSDYSLFFIQPCYSKIASSPTKLGEIMAMGIPVITNGGVGDVAEIVAQCAAGFVVKDFSTDSFNKIIAQLQQPSTFDSKLIRQAAQQHFSLEIGVAQYEKVYENLFHHKGQSTPS